MKVRILRQLIGNAGGVSLRHYRSGQAYDLPPNLANYLVAQGMAVFEMRSETSSRAPNQPERRRKR
jgi:hypothetical protein